MRKAGSFIAGHPWVGGVVVTVVALLGVGGWYVWGQVNVPDLPVLYVVPTANQLVADQPDETLYRVQPLRSSVTYEVGETLAGIDKIATGSTQGIAGDIVLNAADPKASEFGEIVVNVQQLDSDEEMRDRRLRHDFLESGEYPLSRFTPAEIDGLPANIADGVNYDLTIPGELTVKETTRPATLTGTATVSDNEVRLQATTLVKMSDFGIGPIELLGFVRTGDEVTLTFDIVFVDPLREDIPTTTRAATAEQASTGGGPSFRDAVLPILTDTCAGCHNDGGVGSKVWQLNTAQDAVDVASGLSLVTQTRFMPPWPASDMSAPFTHDRSLSQDQIDAVVAWAAAGAELDVDPATPIVAPPPDIAPVRADLTLTADEPYVGSTAKRDDYRCFALDPKVTSTRWMGAYEFVPDQTEIVHHAIGTKITAAGRDSLAARDAADPGPGWSCIDVTGGGAGGGMSNQFLAWAPGQDVTRFPEGTGLKLEPGDLIVLQVHYHFAHSAPADLSRLEVELLPEGVDPLEVTNWIMLAPAELPCRAGLEDGPLCDRDAAIADIATRFGAGPAFIPNGLVGRCGADIAALAADTDGRTEASCVNTVRRDQTALFVFGHMHELGETFRMTLNPGTPSEKVLLDIPVWDFGWQIGYEFVDPLELNEGDKILIECSWDRAHLKVPEARYITWSEGTVDEMCFSGLMVVPRATKPA